MLNNTSSIHYKTIISFLHNIKQLLHKNESIIRTKSNIYNSIYINLCKLTEYYCSNFQFLHSNILLDDINKI